MEIEGWDLKKSCRVHDGELNGYGQLRGGQFLIERKT